ncbi:MAG: hypothetical protein AABX39_03570 [Nanoarchaeota archaeon]
MEYLTNDAKEGFLIVVLLSVIILAGITVAYQSHIKELNGNYLNAMTTAEELNKTMQQEIEALRKIQNENSKKSEREEKIVEEYSSIQQKAEFLERQNIELTTQKIEMLKSEEAFKKEIEKLKAENIRLENELRNTKNSLIKTGKEIDLCEESMRKIRTERDECLKS